MKNSGPPGVSGSAASWDKPRSGLKQDGANFRPCYSSRLFFEGGEDGIQLFAFDVGGGSGDDVAGDAAQDVGVVGGQIFQHVVEEGSDDGDEGVAVVIAEGSQPVALKTDLKNFRQGQLPVTTPFP